MKAAVIAAFVLCIGWSLNVHPAYAQLVQPCSSIGGNMVCPPPNTLCQLEDVIANIISVSVSLAAIALFIMLVFGGIRYLSSGGDPKGTQQAKSTITYAIIGMSLMVIAWFILLFIQTFTGTNVTEFRVCLPP